MKKIQITSEYSAQSSVMNSNPLVIPAIEYIKNNGLVNQDFNKLRVADQGCGKLRHLKKILYYFNIIFLIETEFQINRSQKLFGKKNTNLREYLSNFQLEGKKIYLLTNKDFYSAQLDLDLVFNICIFDVVIPEIRKEMAQASYNNLKKGGLFVLIIPRNISSILKRCNPRNKYLDGHYFHHHGINTFFKNFDNSQPLIEELLKIGYKLNVNLSTRQYLFLIFNKK